MEILIIMRYIKCDRSKSSLPCPLSRSHSILCSQVLDALGNDFLGLCIHDYKRNVIDSQSKKDDREEAR